LVTDAHFRGPLAVIRSLGKKNIKICALSERKSAMGFHSKYCSEKLISPNPRIEPKSYLNFLLKIVKTGDYDCIIPYHTYTAFLLCKYKDIFSDYTKIPPPEFEIFYKVYNKTELLKIAFKNDIPCPESFFNDDIDSIISNIQKYPVVIKSSKVHSVEIGICRNQLELIDKYAEMTSNFGNCIVQEYIPNGGEFGVYTLFDSKSEPLALTVQKRSRTIHEYGGISTLRETVKDEKLVKSAFKLLKSVNWSGVAMVEFRVDARDGIPKLMEINPRLWGSLQLSILSGVDFPYLFYKMITEEKVNPSLCFKDGVLCRWLEGDIKNYTNCKNKLKFILDFFNPNIKYDVLSLKDFIPFIYCIYTPSHNILEERNLKENPIANLDELTV
jgi:predicted ATP-grasp superfamily ATP-dependent carboligase